MHYNICRFLAFVILKIVFRLKIRGRENIPKQGAVIIASNHVSNLDPVVLGAVCLRKLAFMAKEELFKGFLGYLLPRLNVFSVRRNTADLSAVKKSLDVLRNGGALLIFPQGSRRPDLKKEDFQKGVGFLAKQTRAEVIPVFVRGTNEAMPIGSKKIKAVPLSAYFGRPLRFKRGDTEQGFTVKIFQEINKLSLTKN